MDQKVLITALKKVLGGKTYYHGTKSDFDKFTKPGTGKHGPGYYFTPDFNEAVIFSKTLAGDGTRSASRVITVKLSFKKPFNTMSIPDAEKVAEHFGVDYKKPRKHVGGAYEHYHHLEKLLKKNGIIKKDGINKAIEEAGFDAIEYDLMEHIILFDPKKIKILKSEYI